VLVQAFVPELAVETLDKAFSTGLLFRSGVQKFFDQTYLSAWMSGTRSATTCFDRPVVLCVPRE